MGADGGLRGAQDLRHLPGGEALDVAQHQRRSLFLRQGPEPLLNNSGLLPQGRDLGRIRRRIAGLQAAGLQGVLQGDGMPEAASPSQVAADVDRDAIEPRRGEPSRLEAIEVAVEPQEDLLRRILGVFQMPEKALGGVQDLAFMNLQKPVEGADFARPRPRHEVCHLVGLRSRSLFRWSVEGDDSCFAFHASGPFGLAAFCSIYLGGAGSAENFL